MNRHFIREKPRVGLDRFSAAFRQDRYMKARVFVVQTAIASGSIDLAASSWHNQSPSQRQRHHCSTAPQSYFRLITSQRACHLSVF